MSSYMTGAQATIAQVAAEGVRVVFGIPGVHTLPLCDAVLEHARLRFLHGRHEQGIAFMANGYARACGEIALSLVITGPGVTNSLTPLADAYLDSVPMVLVASQVARERRGRGAFHELKDQAGVLASVCKWSTCVERVEAVPDAIRAAFEQAYGGRPGPTAVEIPVDVQSQEGWVDIHPSARPERRQAPADAIREAVQVLAGAASPLVYVGRGAALSGCTDELVRLIELLDAPCITTPLARGVIPGRHPLNASWGGPRSGGVREFLQGADVVLVVGSSLDEADAAWAGFDAEKLVQIDICPEMIGRSYPVSVGLVGDARAVLQQVLAELPPGPLLRRTEMAARVAEGRERTLREAEGSLYWPYIEAIQRALPQDAIVTNDGSQANYRGTVPYLERDLPHTFQVTRMAAALGFALPAALGAKVAFPERPVVAIAGDGGFLFTAFSLSSAVQHGLNVAAVVFNNDAYGIIRRLQTERHGREVGAALRNPDFVRLAEASGARGLRAETPEQLHEMLAAALTHDAPTLIDVPI
ncbi:MAG: thiamine pyrophosphate-binding protein [Anaerolineae bacterium]|nr:thiamine pyrophosphate-binding protein [Anaerolineae bacterium]